MITVETDYGRVNFDYVPGMTVQEAMQATLDTAQLELRDSHWEIRETQTGRVLMWDELIVDKRYYVLTAFVKPRPAFRRS